MKRIRGKIPVKGSEEGGEKHNYINENKKKKQYRRFLYKTQSISVFGLKYEDNQG